jgi:ABC-2 type transport system ATP-binding protein
MATAVSIEAVTKTFGSQTAVDRLNLEVPVGAMYGFIGPNGAGKTTTIRMLMSILFPDSGKLEVLGHPSALEAKDKIGYLPEERGVYKNMKVAAYLKYLARLKGVAEPVIGGRIKELLARVELPDVGGKPCEELSKGMRQKIQFAASIINEPELLILDEPFSGLDPVSMRLLRNLIVEEHQRGATILFSTHVMPQAEEICDHVVMIHKGRKVLDDPVAAIGGRHDVRTIVVEPFDAHSETSFLSRVAGVESQRARGGTVELELKPGADAATVMRDIVGNLRVARIEIKRPRLEDVFIRLVAGDPDDAATLQSELAKASVREVAE